MLEGVKWLHWRLSPLYRSRVQAKVKSVVADVVQWAECKSESEQGDFFLRSGITHLSTSVYDRARIPHSILQPLTLPNCARNLVDQQSIERMVILDFITVNLDRHLQNFLITNEDKIVAIYVG